MTLSSTVGAAFERWLTMPDYGVVDAVLGTIVAGRMSGTPVWLMLVGPSGSGKSEIIGSLGELNHSHHLSSVTPHAFISGYYKAKQPGLLERLAPGLSYLFTFKDFTTIFSLRPPDKSEIMAQLREIYDGRTSKAFGTAKTFTWHGKITVIAGSTSRYDREFAELGTLGERFLLWRMHENDPEALAERSMSNMADYPRLQRELKDAVNALDDLEVPSDLPLHLDTRRYLANLCKFLSIMRTPVLRGGRYYDILEVPEVEATGRLGSQFAQLLKGVAIVRGVAEPTLEEVEIVEHVAFSSIPATRLELVRAIPAGVAAPGRQVERALGLPHTTVRRGLEDLEALKLLETSSGGYRAHPDAAGFFSLIHKRYGQL